jgi:hypothetical protein
MVIRYSPELPDASIDISTLSAGKWHDEWDLPPKPKGTRWVTYKGWEAKYDNAEAGLDAQLVLAAAGLMKRI